MGTVGLGACVTPGQTTGKRVLSTFAALSRRITGYGGPRDEPGEDEPGGR